MKSINGSVWRILAGCAAVVAFSGIGSVALQAESMRVYIGTYTRGASQGIYAFDFDSQTGALQPLGLVAETSNPSFLALHPSGRFLYAVNEDTQFDGQRSGGVTAFEVDAGSGQLRALNAQPSGGGAPCHLIVDKQGDHVLVANYVGGNVSVFPVAADGSLQEASAFQQHAGSSVHPQRQSAPHAHSIQLDPRQRFAVAADLGLDKILIYRYGADEGSLEPHRPAFVRTAPGAGPRHFAFHPRGPWAVVNNEMTSSVTLLGWDRRDGILYEAQTVSTLPESYEGGNSTAEVQFHPQGRFVYCSNRGHDSVAVFGFDSDKGQLTMVEIEPTQGKTPRNFGIDPEGAFLIAANQGSDSLVVFRIDRETGALEPTGHRADVPSPVCVRFLEP